MRVGEQGLARVMTHPSRAIETRAAGAMVFSASKGAQNGCDVAESDNMFSYS